MGERLVTGEHPEEAAAWSGTNGLGPRFATDRFALGGPIGITGALAFTLGSVVAAVAYQGSKGEPYSPLNHWVSELGEVGVSQQAWLFNLGLVIGGVCFALFMAALALSRRGWLRAGFGPVGIVAGLAGALVGVFPMNDLGLHSVVALSFFNLGWIAVGMASIDFVAHRDARFPRWLAIEGAATVVCFVAFLVGMATADVDQASLASPEVRPDVWPLTILEWSVLVGIIGWALLTGVCWWRADRAPRGRQSVRVERPGGVPA